MLAVALIVCIQECPMNMRIIKVKHFKIVILEIIRCSIRHSLSAVDAGKGVSTKI